jgi:hypothetical protein
MWNQYNIANCLESRIGYKEQRLKIGNSGRETRNKEERHGTGDRRQGTKKCDMEQRIEEKEQSCETETGNKGREIRYREVRHLTEDGRQGTEN